MMNDPVLKIGIIIPMYNCENTIIQVFESLEKQTLVKNIQVIIAVNDGSKDSTLSIVTEYAKKAPIKIEVINKKNEGVSSARNKGVQFITDNYPEIEWIAFCDSDDLWHSDKLEIQTNILSSNSKIDCLGTQFNDVKLRVKGRIVNSLIRGTVKDICIQNFPQPSTVIMRRSVFNELGGFDEQQYYAEDGNFFLKVAYYYGLYYYPKCLIEYGFGKRGFGQKGLSKNLKGMYLGNIKNLRELKKKKMISIYFYMEMRLYYWIKYIRRILITLGKI